MEECLLPSSVDGHKVIMSQCDYMNDIELCSPHVQ